MEWHNLMRAFSLSNHHRRMVAPLLWCAVLFTCLLLSSKAVGQGAGLGMSFSVEPTNRGYPSPEYFAALEIYRSGELDRAVDAFEVAISRTRRDINGHWIDAIPAYAMMAECQYHMGDLEGAMQSVDTSLKIAIRYRGWLSSPQWEDVVRTQAVVSPKQYLWPEANAVNRLPVSRDIRFRSGELLTESRLARGGTIEELNIKSVNVLEILRGLAIASYRRRIILGPLSEGDALATGVLDSTKYPAGLQIPIGRSLIGAMRSAERFGAMNDQRCVEDATKYAMFNGGVHPLTPITNLCAASALAGTEKQAAAIPICITVANQAASMDFFEWIGEALQLGAGCATGIDAVPIQQAGHVAATHLLRKSRLAALHCLLASADAAVTAGDLTFAAARLNEARALSMRRDVIQPRLDAYGSYIAARLATRQPSLLGETSGVTPWEDPFAAMMTFATKNRLRKRNLISMPRLYQLQRVRLALGRNLAGQSADQLLERYAANPTIDVWRRDPVDAISGNLADRDSLRIARLRTAASRESAQDVLLRMEDVFAGRFQSQLDLGGRVLQTRALARLPDDLLEKRIVEARNKAPKPIRSLQSAAGAALPADPSAAESKLFGMEMESWSIAFDRYDLPNVVPRPMNQKQPVANLPDDVGVLAFFQDTALLHVVLCTKDRSLYWSIKGSSRIGTDISKVMRGIGATKARGGRLPEDGSWQKDAIELRDRLIMPGTGPLLDDRLAGIKHLVIIPDSLLWYLPFEILPTAELGSPLLGDALKISYAASPGLALSPTAKKTGNPVVAVSAGKFFAPRDVELNEATVQSILDAVPDDQALRLPDQLGIATAMIGESAGHLVVGEPTTPNPSGTLDTPLALYESSSPVGMLRSWLGFPAKKPTTVMLAGYRSNLDTPRPVNGGEISQAIMALQYAGVRDVILSRWAVGGESTATLLREYVQELPFIGSADALGRAQSVLRRSELSPTSEPTLIGKDLERETLTGNEPFFWSTYLHAAPIEID